MVLELLIHAKSAIKKFRPIRGLNCGHVTFKGTNQLPWVGWRGSTQKTQNSQRMIWKYAGIAENESVVF